VDRRPERHELALAHLPTPIERYHASMSSWTKSGQARRRDFRRRIGNKIRKLEFLMARAQAERAEVVITCPAASK